MHVCATAHKDSLRKIIRDSIRTTLDSQLSLIADAAWSQKIRILRTMNSFQTVTGSFCNHISIRQRSSLLDRNKISITAIEPGWSPGNVNPESRGFSLAWLFSRLRSRSREGNVHWSSVLITSEDSNVLWHLSADNQRGIVFWTFPSA